MDAGWRFQRRNPSSDPGQCEAQDGDERLADLRREADETQGHRCDQGDPGRQAVQAIDEVDAVDHPHDPEDREAGSEDATEHDDARSEGVVDEVDDDAGADGEDGHGHLAGELPACLQIEEVIDRAERRRSGSTKQEGSQFVRRDRDRNERQALVDQQECDAGQQEGRGDGESPRPWHRDGVDPALLRQVHHLVVDDEAADERRQREGQDRCAHEDDEARPDDLSRTGDEVHAAGSPGTGNRSTIS